MPDYVIFNVQAFLQRKEKFLFRFCLRTDSLILISITQNSRKQRQLMKNKKRQSLLMLEHAVKPENPLILIGMLIIHQASCRNVS